MSLVQILNELPKLTREELAVVAEHIARTSEMPIPAGELRQRVPGLHNGMIWVADDFDEHLGDEFWLGEDA